MIQPASLKIPEEDAHVQDRAALGAAVDLGGIPIPPDLQAIIQQWVNLPDSVKADVVAMVEAATKRSQYSQKR